MLEYYLQNSGKFIIGIIMVIPENGGNRKLDIMAVNGSKWQILTEIGHSSYSEFFDWKHNYNFMSP